MAKIDSLLEQQLAVAGTKPVEAVVMLKPDGKTLVPTPEATSSAAKSVIERALSAANVHPNEVDYNVFEQMGSFAISAPAQVIRHIVGQPEVAGAMANQQARGFAKYSSPEESVQ